MLAKLVQRDAMGLRKEDEGPRWGQIVDWWTCKLIKCNHRRKLETEKDLYTASSFLGNLWSRQWGQRRCYRNLSKNTTGDATTRGGPFGAGGRLLTYLIAVACPRVLLFNPNQASTRNRWVALTMIRISGHAEYIWSHRTL